MLVEDHQLQGVVKLPAGVFRPYAGVSTAILLFRRTDSGGTEGVWFYDMQADGFSLDDRRNPLVPGDRIGPWAELDADEAALNDLPDALARWQAREGAERANPRTARSFVVPKAEIAAAGYDLSLNRYREIEHDAVQAAHGATWGRLPDEALFLARQRGLDEATALSLILHGMAASVLAGGLGDEALADTVGATAALTESLARHLRGTRGGEAAVAQPALTGGRRDG